MIGDRLSDEDDSVFEEAGIDVVAAFAAAGLFNNDGNEWQGFLLVFHCKIFPLIVCEGVSLPCHSLLGFQAPLGLLVPGLLPRFHSLVASMCPPV